MGRVRFRKGKQREFLDLVIKRLNAVSLRGILQFGLKVPYSTLKNYYGESRLLPEDFFEDLLGLSGISRDELDFEFLEENWGKVKGGRISKRRKVYN